MRKDELTLVFDLAMGHISESDERFLPALQAMVYFAGEVDQAHGTNDVYGRIARDRLWRGLVLFAIKVGKSRETA